MDVVTLERETREADAAIREARARLVAAVRSAHASGLSQREIAAHSNRSQPEIRRLLKFHGTSPHGRRLRAHRDTLVALLAASGLHNVRVFGSTARGTDHQDSDIDLLVSADTPLGLFAQAQIEQAASELLALPVDLVLDDAIRPDLRERILNEAVPL
jgi:predicted nucleotidyltransferase